MRNNTFNTPRFPSSQSNKQKNNWQSFQQSQKPSSTTPATSTQAPSKDSLLEGISDKTKNLMSSRYFWTAVTLTAAGAALYYFSKKPSGKRAIENASNKTRETYDASIAMLNQWVNYSKFYTGHLKASPAAALTDAKNKHHEITNQIKALEAIKTSNKTFIEAIEATQKSLKIAAENIGKQISEFEAILSANTHLSDADIQAFSKAINDQVLSSQMANSASKPLIEVLEESSSTNNSDHVNNDKLNYPISDEFQLNKSNNDEESAPTPNNSLTSPASQTANTQPLAQKANVQQFIADDITMISFANAEALTKQQNKLSIQNNNATMKPSASTESTTESSSDDESVTSDGVVNIKKKVENKTGDQNSNPTLHTQDEQNSGYLKRALSSFGSTVGGLLWRSNSGNTQHPIRPSTQEDINTLKPASPLY